MSGFNRATGICVLLLVIGCDQGSSNHEPAPAVQPPVTAPLVAAFKVTWGPESECADPGVNQFVQHAVSRCAARDYEEYRLLWRFDHRPTSRKRFMRLWSAVEQVEIKLVKKLVFKDELNGDQSAVPNRYVFHAFVRIKPEIVEQSDGAVADHDLVLLIVPTTDGWALAPAPKEIKDIIVQRAAGKPPAASSNPLGTKRPEDSKRNGPAPS